MNKKDRGIIIGMCLGDGCIKRKSKDYKELTIYHSHKQLRYLQDKAYKLHKILGGKQFKIYERKVKLNNNKEYVIFGISRQHPYFKLLHRWLYNGEGKKEFTRKILDKLTPEGIAYWYMDDGSLVVHTNKAGEISSFQIRLHTYCSLKECEDMIQYFKDTYDINFHIAKHTNKEQYSLRANTKEGNKFLSLIYPYKLNSMDYKFIEPRVLDID